MIYQVKVPKVEAEAVVLSTGRVFVVNVNGTPHVMAAASFEQLYAPVEERTAKDGAIADAVKALPIAPSRRPAAKTVNKGNANPGLPDVTAADAVVKALANGPMTRAELTEQVCNLLGLDYRDKSASSKAYQAIWTKVQTGKVVKRDDPVTQLTKYHLGGAA